MLEFSKIGMLSSKRWSESSMDMTEESVALHGTTLFWAVGQETRASSIEIQEWRKIISQSLRDTSKKCVGLSGVQMSNSSPLEVTIINWWYGARPTTSSLKPSSTSMSLQWKPLLGPLTSTGQCVVAEEQPIDASVSGTLWHANHFTGSTQAVRYAISYTLRTLTN